MVTTSKPKTMQLPTQQTQDRMISHKQAQDKVVAHHPGTGSVATTLVLPGASHGTWPI